MLNKAACLLSGNNLVSQVVTLTVGTGNEYYDYPVVGFESVTADGGPFGSLSPARFLETNINRFYTIRWADASGRYWRTLLNFTSFSHPTPNVIRATRLDTGVSVDLKPYYTDNDGYRNNSFQFITQNDIGKTIQIKLTELTS